MATTTETTTDRRQQIMQAAMVCFAKRGFHQATMHDISAEADISVGLIYRYFENKDAVISAMADDHKREVVQLIARARQAPTLLEALEIFFTAHCCARERQIEAAFVIDLFAEGARNPRVARLVRDVLDTLIDGVTELIAHSPEMRRIPHEMKPRDIAELIFATARGMMVRDAVDLSRTTDAKRRARQLEVLQDLWNLIFTAKREPAFA